MIDVGGDLSGGGQAKGRRVKLPWGGGAFDFSSFTDDAHTIIRRSITWAAAPIVYTGVEITLQIEDVSKKLMVETHLLNRPEVQ